MSPGTEVGALESSELTRTGAIAGIALVALLVVGAASALIGHAGGGLQNWFLLLNSFNSESTGATFAALKTVRVVDIAALVLAGVTFLGVRPLLGTAQRAWVTTAAALPFVGIIVLVAAGFAGCSALSFGGLIVGWRMTKSDRFRLVGWMGACANSLLILTVLNMTATPDPALADVVALGYALLVIWLVWLALRMVRPLPGHPVPVGTHLVGTGGGCRAGGSETTETFDLPLYAPAEGPLGTFTGVADESTRFTIGETDVDLMRFLEAYDEDVRFEIRVEEPGKLAAMTIDPHVAENQPTAAQEPTTTEEAQ
jgi:hypothetical protein